MYSQMHARTHVQTHTHPHTHPHPHTHTHTPVASSRRGKKCDGRGFEGNRTGEDGRTGRNSEAGGVTFLVATHLESLVQFTDYLPMGLRLGREEGERGERGEGGEGREGDMYITNSS